MLYRLILTSETAGLAGLSTLSLAQILGVSVANNRRDDITSCMVVHRGHILQVAEGARTDLDRLLRRLRSDPRHSGLRVLSDAAISARGVEQPMTVCADPAVLLQRIGLPCLSKVSANDAEAMLDLPRAA